MADLLLGRTLAVDGVDRSDVSVSTQDLVTHGVIVGMTGSGKTGLGIGLIEEALASGVPALLIDPKGDLTNLALIFPGLSGPEFEPWVDPAAAKADGTDVPTFAAKQAELWRAGLSNWGIDGPALQSFKDSFELTIYTPGSSAGVPLNMLGSLRAPETDDEEVLADEVDGYVTSLLGAIGINADPLTSREHVLLSNLIHQAWTAGESIDLATLLARVQQPPMRKLGVFELDQFFPAKDRQALAMKINTVLAAPSFQQWITGPDIDIDAMLRSPDGKPRCAVVTTAHLSEPDRQSATALILAKFVTWMRRQSGTTDLRALLYMDEVAGYLPPTAMPATKKPILLLMKQARAFGVGVVLSTQNPVDVDYKALSNAGTWMIGRLTTQRDKERLLAGMSDVAGGIDTTLVGEAISGLGKREFLLRKAGANDVQGFGTKWVRSYLRGPLTRDQISQVQVQDSPPIDQKSAEPAATPAPALADDETAVMPQTAAEIPVAFLDPAAPWSDRVGAVAPSGEVPKMAAAAVARVLLRFTEAKADLVHEEEFEAIIYPLPATTAALEPMVVDYDDRDLLAEPPAAARYRLPAAKIGTKTYWTGLNRDLVALLVRERSVDVPACLPLKAYARPGETMRAFEARCQQLASAAADNAAAQLQAKYQNKLRTLQTRYEAAAGRAQQADRAQSTAMMTNVGSILGGFLGGRRSAASIGAAARRQQAASNRAATAAARVDEIAAQMADVEAQLTEEVADLVATWQARAADISTVRVALAKSDVRVTDLRLVWIPVG